MTEYPDGSEMSTILQDNNATRLNMYVSAGNQVLQLNVVMQGERGVLLMNEGNGYRIICGLDGNLNEGKLDVSGPNNLKMTFDNQSNSGVFEPPAFTDTKPEPYVVQGSSPTNPTLSPTPSGIATTISSGTTGTTGGCLILASIGLSTISGIMAIVYALKSSTVRNSRSTR